MSEAGRKGLSKVFGSPEYLSWASRVGNLIDARKLASEFAGVPKKTCGSRYAQGLQDLCRENPPLPKPPPPAVTVNAPFDGRGLFLLEPTGGTEDIRALAAAGFTYALLNLGFARGGSWDVQRQRCSQFGVEVVPWARVLTTQDSRLVEETAAAWGCRATAHNLEVEAASSYPPANLAAFVDQNFPKRSRAVITEPWAQPGAGWGALRDWVAIPETFLNADGRFLPADLVGHCHEEGMPMSVPAFGWGAWSDAPIFVPPARYLELWPKPSFAVYFGDSREPQYGEWKR